MDEIAINKEWTTVCIILFFTMTGLAQCELFIRQRDLTILLPSHWMLKIVVHMNMPVRQQNTGNKRGTQTNSHDVFTVLSVC